MGSGEHFGERRALMVERQLAGRGISDRRVLSAMGEVPREAFVPEGQKEFAYFDGPLPIGEEQTISQPYIVALMIEAAEIGPGARVLEIGAGSGYAAAVIGRIAERVIAIERHGSLAEKAKERLAGLRYDNVRVMAGDGTQGFAEEAPYEAILVAAGGQDVPPALKAQLAIGGHLVIPVGRTGGAQTLRRLTRTGPEPDDFREEEFGAVRFVPLVAGGAPAEDGTRAASNHLPGLARGQRLEGLIAEAAEPLPSPDDEAIGEIADRFADHRVVLLGEASHGTHEFYRAREMITRRLVERHGFSVVAVEADWPDAAALDRFVRGQAPKKVFKPFTRFPDWMWRNTDVLSLTRWMRQYNESADRDEQAGFYGLDLYSMSASIAAILNYLDENDPAAARIARERYGCLAPYSRDPAAYGRAALTRSYQECEAAVTSQCRELLEKRLADGEGAFDAAQNARLVAAAERYYRIMYYGGAESWNLRDTHMAETLEQLLTERPGAKAVVWAHNSHIGDARYTEMGAVRGELNLGQLVRERIGEAALIGFGTHEGAVAAASEWGGPMEIKRVRPSLEGSVERACADAREEGAPGAFLLDLREGENEALRRAFFEPRPERFIGVIYRPQTERISHYADAALSRQFDAYIFFTHTSAVTPLEPAHPEEGPAETWPFGL